MTLFIVAYVAGVFTITTPCILPILPFILARTDIPFRRGGLPMLIGLVIGFAAVASLGAVAGAWAVEANQYGRSIALAIMALFGLTLLLPGLAAYLTRPIVALGSTLSNRADRHNANSGQISGSSLLLGIATGLIWAPCAGPVLGLILTGAALNGANVETTLLLLAYASGAATSLAAGVLVGGGLLKIMKRGLRWSDGVRRILGGAVIAGVATFALGLDSSLLAGWSSSNAERLERDLISIMGKEHGSMIRTASAASTPALSAPLFSLLGAREWLNTPPLQPDALRGKVVLVNFWTYSCINCLRVLPHVRSWAQKFRDRGLVVIGVHTPEFAFERSTANVKRALAALGVSYPIAIDSDFGIWRAFNNRAWPALYFIGADGRIRHRVLGEGSYDQSERLIERLLDEANAPAAVANVGATNMAVEGPQLEADARDLRSSETYIGYAQSTGFASLEGLGQDTPRVYQPVSRVALNQWNVTGNWTIGSEFASLNEASGFITYRFHARDLHLVLAPPVSGQAVRFRVRIDGAAPGADHGFDVDAQGWGTVKDARLYQLIRQTGPVADRTFEIEFLDVGVRAYAFTFG